MVLGLNAVHVRLPKGAPVHAANLIHRLSIKGRIADVHAILEPAHAIGFVGAVGLDGDAWHEHGGLGAARRATGGKSENNGGKNECFFHCGYGLKVKKLVAFKEHQQHGSNKADGGDRVG
jgi:hypothetical protein